MEAGVQMKVIFSRKGFDSSYGGTPSPIFPDGRMVALPIPDRCAKVRFNEIRWQEFNLGELAMALTKGKVKDCFYAHLDPDLREGALARTRGWRPCFGQEGSAQGHLKGKDIGRGDLFLFFGWFKEVEQVDGGLRYRKTPDLHVLWGWLLIDEVLGADILKNSPPPWAKDHPHVAHAEDRANKGNTLYVAAETLASLGLPKIKGGGVFNKFKPSLQLTAPGRTARMWKLPRWFYPENQEQALSYHTDYQRWEKHKDHVVLKSAAPGQEFVLDSMFYPELEKWLKDLFSGE